MPDGDLVPVDVDVRRTEGVTLTWSGGVVTEHALDRLRRSCTCAECRGRRERGLRVGPPPGATVEIVDAELVGAWGIRFEWTDGHGTGIYSWELLRHLAGQA